MNMENNRDVEDGEENGREMVQSVTEANEYNYHTNRFENGDSGAEENEQVGTIANVSKECEISVLAQTIKEEIDDDCDMGFEVEEHELSENGDGSNTEQEDEQIGSGASDAVEEGCDEEDEPIETNSIDNGREELKIEGRRIADLFAFVDQLRRISQHNDGNCFFSNLQIQKEIRIGFHSKIIFKCVECSQSFRVYTNDDEKTTDTIDINSLAVLGANMVGIGYSQLEQFSSILDLPPMCNDKFKKLNDNMGEYWRETAEKLMREAAEEESKAAIAQGDVDPIDGIPFIKVVTDACWSKRSFNKNFTALSGVGAIVGAHTGKVLWIGVRNRYCPVCVRAMKGLSTPRPHSCTKNFTGPSSEMEWEIILEGFKSSVELYKLRYLKLISDGDSSTYSKLLQQKPYGDRHIEKIECTNHLHRNFRKSIEASVKGCPRGLNKVVVNNLERIRKDIYCAIDFRKRENTSEAEKISLLKSDLKNLLHHVFGDHSNCPKYIEKYCQNNNQNYVPALQECNTFEKMSSTMRQLMYCAKDLIQGESNNIAEHYNSIVAKFVGGKRVNFSLSNSYKHIANLAAVQFNSKTALSALYNAKFNRNPPELARKLEVKRLHKTNRAKERRKIMKQNKVIRTPSCRMKESGPGPGYGIHCEKPDMPEEVFQNEKRIHFAKLTLHHENRNAVEADTRDKTKCNLWNAIVPKVILSQDFGSICKARTFPGHVKELTQRKSIGTKAQRHQNESQSVAMQQLGMQENMSIRSCGLFIDEGIIFLAASPTAMVNDSDMIIDIQCPLAITNKDPNDINVLGSTSQLIVHSSRVWTPKRHNSESVFYMDDDSINSLSPNNKEQSNRNNHRLFPVSTYTEDTISPELNPQNNYSTNQAAVSPNNGQQWSVADRINELERQNQSNNKSIANNQKYTYLDPTKTTRVPNMTLKAFQKNAVQSYFERQQQISPTKEASPNTPTSRINQAANGTNANGHLTYDNNLKSAANATSNGINLNDTNVIRPQSLPANKLSSSMELIPQTRLSLPNKLSQIINLTTQLAAQKQSMNGNVNLRQPNNRINSPVKSTAVKLPSKQSRSTIITVDKNNLQSINESGVPPPPLRRSNRALMPARRTSSAAEYSAYRDQHILKQSLSNNLLGPVVMGPIISLDEWIPERPPKNPMLRIPRPDLPPPPTPLANNNEIRDDPLPPPPPPEILRYVRQSSDPDCKFNTANRRNSFAGSTSRKPFIRTHNFDNLSPPLLPRKPESMELFNPRPFSSMRQPHGYQVKQAIPQGQQSVKLVLNVRTEQPNDSVISPQSSAYRSPSNDNRVSVRKRTHNAPMSLASTDENRIRSNSKASYLPRQSHEKLTSDPDHGSYKLTLNSNEDCIHLPHYNGQLHSTKINNLPDVLPLGVKMKSVSATRYGSNTALNNGNGDISNGVINGEKRNHHGGNINSYTNGKVNSMMNSTKYISQSTIDLKRAHHLFNNNVCTRITSTESLGNLLDCSNHRQSSPPNLQHMSATEQRTQITTANLTVAQHNAMNTNGLVQLPMHPYNDDKLIRCNNIMGSLLTARDHDGKISQLQTKLLSSQRIHHANIAEINDEDAFNDCHSTNDSSSVSQLSSESISSIESHGQTCKEIPNHNSIKPDALNDMQTIDENQLADDVAAVKLNETITSEVGSQTDESILDDTCFIMDNSNESVVSTKTEIINRTKFADEFDCKKLTETLVEQLSPNDRLRNILAPKMYKSTSDYVTDLYNPKMATRFTKKDAGTSMHREQRLDLTENTSSNYLLNNSNQHMSRHMNGSRFNRDVQLINADVCDLTKQKEELVTRLSKQLFALMNDRTSIADQNTTNDLLGLDISSVVAQKVRPSEASKFRSHVDDVGHITMLLLSLSGRLARIEKSLFTTTDQFEKKTLESKRTRLLEQLDEAKRLKTDIDRRGKIIAHVLEKHLTTKEYADYDYFINSKAKLIVDLREVADRIQLAEDQLNALKETLIHSEC